MESLEEWTPDIVVGIDFGMTFTGAAYSFTPRWSHLKTIQRWPGTLPSELANKAPTCVEYRPDCMEIKGWGFLCNPEEEASDIKEFFKLHLSPHYQEDYPGAPSRREAQRWFRDYIREIYKHVVATLSNTFPLFPSRRVEFIFSVPTTWKDPRMIEEVRGLIDEAIHSDSPNHRAVIGLTEAEAAAVYACKQLYQKDDVILICDAGGGTTDVNVLKLVSSPGAPIRLQQLNNVEGRPIGSVFIDKSIHHLICQRLERIRHCLGRPPNEIAWKMISGRFQRFKCSFGEDAISTLPSLKLDVPTLGRGSSFPEAEIYNGQMSIAREEIQRCFDDKIDDMCDFIDVQLDRMHLMHPFEHMSYLVLSGGFGSSAYVRQRLCARYSSETAVKKPNAESIQVITADEPYLAVVHGLVMNRAQQLERGVVYLGSRCCRVSYGIICSVPYNAQRHLGEPVKIDSRDKKTYAINQIDWIVKQGEPIPPTGLSRPFGIKVEPGQINDPWKVHVVMSTLPARELPQSMTHDGAKSVCILSVYTEGVEKKLKNRHWYNSDPAYWMVKFNVKVVVGPADLKFELWSENKQIRSSKHEPIAVAWTPYKKETEGEVSSDQKFLL
ncbi:hypothetical protein AJ80_02010 [Polytolypa hystricis UAMH7299]|uniref:Hsp70-like protein n=1 Tax=Polytolypa hystricis (strain UAMH7299) TaxID=1447883 RepID=A0A2B7YSS5_POLH7|nr:hypothetical protein AJ80_02010 [Polytolypa hystricis UAMH7299]